MNSLFKVSFFFFCCVAVLGSCSHDSVIPSSPEISFKHDVQSIISSNCALSGCHTGSVGELFPLISYADITDLVKKGDAKSSRLYESITGKSASLMPPPPQQVLTNAQIGTVFIWIEQGAKDN